MILYLACSKSALTVNIQLKFMINYMDTKFHMNVLATRNLNVLSGTNNYGKEFLETKILSGLFVGLKIASLATEIIAMMSLTNTTGLKRMTTLIMNNNRNHGLSNSSKA